MGDTTDQTQQNGSENATGATGGNAATGGNQQQTDAGKGGGGKEFTAITSQEDFDKAIQDRIARAEAQAVKPYADYEQQKADAEKWRKAEDDKKPADQRQAEEFDRLRKENETLRAGQIRADVATAKGVPAALLTGSTKEELEAQADALLEFRGKVPGGPVVGNENTGNAGGNTKANSKDWLGDALRG
ncbi:hypothetical protein [Rhodococcoides fascians]|uniref:hypothetical protein n=1 Tax=Rhodococcoides fascians TaxID=1828 RepID=UPI000690F827|nr:hypothetical protein [Rhodococcus fascians]